MKADLERLADCIEAGKVDREAAFPPRMKGEDGAAEWTARILDAGVPPREILEKALITGMSRLGDRFAKGLAYIPDVLFAAKAMDAAMARLRPHFESGEIRHRGTAILGTVAGDVHDIGKNIVRMVLTGGGWNVVDLGVDVGADRFLRALEKHRDSIVGMSALLTTTMVNMGKTVDLIRQHSPSTRIFVGGAPLTAEFAARIGADGYYPDPHRLVKHLAGEAR